MKTADEIKSEARNTLGCVVRNALFGMELWATMADIEGLIETAEYKNSIFALETFRLLLDGNQEYLKSKAKTYEIIAQDEVNIEQIRGKKHDEAEKL